MEIKSIRDIQSPLLMVAEWEGMAGPSPLPSKLWRVLMKVKIIPIELEKRMIDVIDCLFLEREVIPEYTRDKIQKLATLYRKLDGNKLYRK